MTGHRRVSVCIPVLNEEEVLPLLLSRVGAVLDALPGDGHELVIVDDGSTDRTRAMLAEAATRDPRLVVVFLSRNFGHQAALSAALQHATGDAVLLMDGDLQDPPEILPTLLARLDDGHDVVVVRRESRPEGLLKRAAYWSYYRALRALTGGLVPEDAGDFSLLSRRAADAMRALPEQDRFLRGLRAWVGFRQAFVPLPREARAAGRPKYTVRRLLRLAANGVFSFSVVPIRVATVAGAMAAAGSVIFAVYAVAVRVFGGRTPAGFTALAVLVTFLSGANLFFLGIVGEYVGRIYLQVKGRPTFLVEHVVRGRDLHR